MNPVAREVEDWRPVPSVPGVEASSAGRVRVTPRAHTMPKGGVQMRGGKPTFGTKMASKDRYQFAVYRNGKRERFLVSRLVCEAFHGPAPEGKPYALHGDENSLNNRPINLSWGDQRENLNAPGYLAYRRSCTGDANPYRRGKMRRQETQHV